MPRAPKTKSSSGPIASYFRSTRDLSTSIVLLLPLFVAYQLGVLLTGGLRNGVDFITSTLFAVFSGNTVAYAAFNLLVLVIFAVLLRKLKRDGAFRPSLFPWLFLETGIYALCLGSTVVFMINSIGLGGLLSAGPLQPSMNIVDKIVMSAGAGLYEELVFRLCLMSGAALVLERSLGFSRAVAMVMALLVSSVVFSAVHHINEPFTVSAFTFRIFAGVLFAALFWARGLAVAAYTHFLYDVYVMVFRQ